MIIYKNVRKSYGDREIIKDVNFTVEQGEFVVMIGPSGCGKTTTVKMLNRLIEPSGGQILINGVDNREMDLVKLRTSIGYVIQQIGLFPNMTVAENISVVPKIMKWDKEKTRKRVRELMDIVNMPYEEYGRKYPKQLSGGQQQRIGVLRALAVNPPIILMDEPFGALDPITREILQSEVKKIQKELNNSVLFITHDMHEAMKMADRVIFMDKGHILQEAPPKEMVLHPANEEIRKFISLQEVSISGDQLTAGDMMLPYNGIISADAPVVSMTEGIKEISQNIDLSKYKQIYVKDEQGALIGELSMESIIQSLIKQV